MHRVIAILLGTLLTGGASLCLGTVLFRKLRIQAERVEYLALAFVVGSACFSQVVFFLCSVGLARQSVFLAIGLLAATAALGLTRRIETRPPLPSLSRRWKFLLGLPFAIFGSVYFVNALAPEMSPDGAAYHLPLVARYLSAHAFVPITSNLYASLSQGIELLFLPAFSLGGASAAAMVHFLFLIDLSLMMVCYGRRFGFPVPAALAAFLVFAAPAVGWDATSAYNDVAVAAILFALFYLLQIWDQERISGLLIPIGILAGASYAAKYSAAIAVPYALGFVAWKLWRARKPLLRPILTVSVLAAFLILPWMIKNTVFVGNPLAPFANALFPNPVVHVSFERQYLANLRHYQLAGALQAPWELTVKGEKLQGFFGPVFLLLPLALLSLRRREGRRLLFAGAVFAIPWFFNVGARFLIPALPTLTLALALALARPLVLLPAIALVHALLSWYAAPFRYFDAYAPRISSFPLRAALGIEPEDAYLARRSPGYLIDRMIEREVPPGETVFSFDAVPEAWTTRQILIGYYSAENEALSDVFLTAMLPGFCPEHALDYRFPPRRLKRLRAIQRGSDGRAMAGLRIPHLLPKHPGIAGRQLALPRRSESLGCPLRLRQQPGDTLAVLASRGARNVSGGGLPGTEADRSGTPASRHGSPSEPHRAAGDGRGRPLACPSGSTLHIVHSGHGESPDRRRPNSAAPRHPLPARLAGSPWCERIPRKRRSLGNPTDRRIGRHAPLPVAPRGQRLTAAGSRCLRLPGRRARRDL